MSGVYSSDKNAPKRDHNPERRQRMEELLKASGSKKVEEAWPKSVKLSRLVLVTTEFKQALCSSGGEIPAPPITHDICTNHSTLALADITTFSIPPKNPSLKWQNPPSNHKKLSYRQIIFLVQYFYLSNRKVPFHDLQLDWTIREYCQEDL